MSDRKTAVESSDEESDFISKSSIVPQSSNQKSPTSETSQSKNANEASNIMDSDNPPTEKKAWDIDTPIRTRSDGHKEHFCFICGLRDFTLPRHFQRHHRLSTEVKDILSLPVNSKERRDEWTVLERKGDFEANLRSFKKYNKPIVFVRRGTEKQAEDSTSCPHCFGAFSSRHLYKHAKHCINKSDNEENSITSLMAGRILINSYVAEGKFQDVHRLVLSNMRRDDLHLLIRNDSNLLLYAKTQLMTKEKDRYHDIRFSLRVMARMVLELRKNDCNARSEDLILPCNFDAVVAAAHNLCGFMGPREMKTPTTFLKCGFCLRRLALVLRAVALKEESNETLQKIRNFLELYESEWQDHAKQARECYSADKGNAPEKLPLPEDLQKFRNFVVAELNSLIEAASQAPNESILKRLAKFALARLMIFNARRGSEVAKLKIRTWKGVLDGRWKRESDIDKINDKTEKCLARRLKLCYVEGKKNAKGEKGNNLVPILFTDESVEAIKIIVADNDNDKDYIFASGELYLKGWDTLQGIAKSIEGIQKPELITPTRNRKFVATTIQLMDMNKAELTWVTNHLGHSTNVHFQWYRKEESTVELTKIAKLLVALDEGKEVKNKKIDDLSQNAATTSIQADGDEARDIGDEIENTGITARNDSDRQQDGIPTNVIIPNEPLPKKKKKLWNPWSKEEIELLQKIFKSQYFQGVVPTVFDVRMQVEKNPVLAKRGVENIRNKIRNDLKKEGRRK